MFLSSDGSKVPMGVIRVMVLDGLHELAKEGDSIARQLIGFVNVACASGCFPMDETAQASETKAPEAPAQAAPEVSQYAKPRTTNYDFLKRGNLNN